jgi:predicted RNA binding protein YcfA (HicA-like mRNA interferase family)
MPRLTPVHWCRLVCVFELEGFSVVRQEGDHVVLTKPGCRRPLVIPQWPEVPRFIINNNLRTAGISRK